MKLLVLLDNTVLSNFAQANLTSVIYALWKGQVGTTVEAISEYRAGIKSVGLSASAWKSLQIIESTSEESNFGASLSAKLGRGERSCVAVAYLRNALFATDDLLARKIALRYRIQMIGTVGILIQCVNREVLILPHAQQALNQMIAAGYHSPIQSLEDL